MAKGRLFRSDITSRTKKDWYEATAYCTECGKKRYETQEIALATARNLTKGQTFFAPTAEKLRVYKCPYGNLWHLTSRKKK